MERQTDRMNYVDGERKRIREWMERERSNEGSGWRERKRIN